MKDLDPAVAAQLRTAIHNALASELGNGSYDCTRVWEAWSVGTMSQDDFSPTLERLDEIVETVLAAIPAPAAAALASTPSPLQAGPISSAQGPAELWLQLHGELADEFDLTEEVDYTSGDVTWCWHAMNDHDVRYVRADLAAHQVAQPAVSNAMALTFHHAITDGDLPADDMEDIKRGLRAVLAAHGITPLSSEKGDGQ